MNKWKGSAGSMELVPKKDTHDPINHQCGITLDSPQTDEEGRPTNC